MDKNTIIGFILILAVLGGFSYLNKPSEEELARQKAYNDSIALVQQQELRDRAKLAEEALTQKQQTTNTENGQTVNDLGAFGVVSDNKEESFVGYIQSAELKQYLTHDSLPLMLFDKGENLVDYIIPTQNNRVVKTSQLHFEKVGEIQTDSKGTQIVTLRLKTTNENSYIDYIYRIPKDNYMISYQVKANKMNEIVPLSTTSLELNWNGKIRQQERGCITSTKPMTMWTIWAMMTKRIWIVQLNGLLSKTNFLAIF